VPSKAPQTFSHKPSRFRFWLWLIRLTGVIVPTRVRSDWRQEWEAELQNREALLERWDRLRFSDKVDLVRRSTSAFWDALWLQPQRLEEEMFQDLRYGTRMLAKNPGFTAMAVLSLALGIGANAAIFSVLDAVLLKSLPVKQPDRLVFVETGVAGSKRSSNISYSEFETLREQKDAISDATFFSYPTRINIGINGESEVVEGQLVSGGFFTVLGAEAIAGRTILESDDRASSTTSVVVISHRYWQRRFGSDANVIGRSVNLNGSGFTIVGVLPSEFFGVMPGYTPDLYIPSIAGEAILSRRVRFREGSMPFILARLSGNVSTQQASVSLSHTLQQLRLSGLGTKSSPEKEETIKRQPINLVPAGQGFSTLRSQFSKPLRLLLAAVALVLLIACANVTNLLLARAASRGKEIALRLALGATRFRLIRQLLSESALLAAFGAAAGLALASWGSRLLVAVVASGRNPMTAGSQLSLNVGIDNRVLGFTALISLLSAVLVGLVPAWRATKPELYSTLKDSPTNLTGGGRFRWGQVLVVGQVAISLALLIGAGLFVRSLANLRSVDLGFKRENVLLFSTDPDLVGYQRNKIPLLYQQLLERLSTVPGVQLVSLSRQGLLNGGGTTGSVRVPGYEPRTQETTPEASKDEEANLEWLCDVGPRFFETAGTPIIRGRDFGPQDNVSSQKVVIVNEAFAKYYFGSDDPIGQHIDRGEGEGELEIVGVVKDAKYVNIRENTPRTFYVPLLQAQSAWRETTFLVRTSIEPATLASAIKTVVQAIDPNLPIFRVRTLTSQVDESLGTERLVTTLASVFGGLALLLSGAGLFGVLSYSVNRRTHEIGIRMALGARAATVLGMIIRQGMTLVLTGLLVGVIAAFTLTRLLTSLLFGVQPTDPVTFITVGLLLCGVALFACWLPARRAARVDPVTALRRE
jgi:predicted permease